MVFLSICTGIATTKRSTHGLHNGLHISNAEGVQLESLLDPDFKPR